MQLRDAYYAVKPAIPHELRLALRRVHAGRIRRRSGGSWPIAPASEQPPDGWPGWPEGRKFAFVLTHDVEGLRQEYFAVLQALRRIETRLAALDADGVRQDSLEADLIALTRRVEVLEKELGGGGETSNA